MIITPVDDIELIEALNRPSGPRTTGVLHLSQIYGSLMKKLQPKRFNTGKPMDMLRVNLGLCFENMLEKGLAERFATVRPGEIVGYMDDTLVYMSPDGVNPTLNAGEEYKATWMSSGAGLVDEDGQPLEKFVHYFIQMKGYAKWLEVDRFLLRILFVNGDYKWTDGVPTGPQFKTYDITFVGDEIEDNWTMLTNHARSEGMLT
jgi:hypothetical protein